MPEFQDSEVCRNILESLQTGLCVLDLQKKIVFWSSGAERITGFLRHEVVGQLCTANILTHCDQKKCGACGESCPLGSALRTARPTEGACWLHHKAGHQVAVQLHSAPVRDSHGSIIGIVEDFDEQPAASVDHHEDGLKAGACVDALTGIASHALMQSHLRETLATFSELNVPFGLLLLRLEGLEEFRARHSQEAAAALLRAVARTLEGALWRTDYAGRWSEDQFLIILNGCSEDALRAVLARIRRMVTSEAIEWWGEHQSLPISLGNASAEVHDTLQSLLARLQQSLNSDAVRHPHPAADARSHGAGS